MKVSIIKEDNTVYLDGIATRNVDLSFLPNNVRAVQWDESSKQGHIEKNNEPNEKLESFDHLALLVQAVDSAKIAAKEKFEKDLQAAKAEAIKKWTRKIDVVEPAGGNDPDYVDSPIDDVIPAISLISNLWVKQMLFQKTGDCHPGHKHNFDHQTLLAKGSVEINVNGKKTVFNAPSIIFIKAGLRHGMIAMEDDTIVYCVHPLRDGEQVEDIIAPENVPNGVWPLIQEQPKSMRPASEL